jgi:hypothetical protein
MSRNRMSKRGSEGGIRIGLAPLGWFFLALDERMRHAGG